MITPGKPLGFASYFVFLLLVSAGLLASLFSMGCGCSGSSSGSTTTTTHTDTPPQNGIGLETINRKSGYQIGDKVEVRLMGFWPAEDGTGALRWFPPHGSTGFTFPPDMQPEPGGPPFTFKNLTSEQAKAGIAVSYNAPPPLIINGKPWGIFEDQLHVVSPKSHYGAMSHPYADKTTAVSGANPWTQVQAAPDPARTGVTFWEVARSAQFNTEFTSASCEDLVAQVNIDMAQEIRADATAWANSHLPAAPGAWWVALGVKLDVVTDCTGFTILPDFTLVSFASLNLSSRPAACAGCEIAMYVCYKSAPAGNVALADAPPPVTTPDGFTCLGPGAQPLIVPGDWLFEPNTAAVTFKPGDALQMHYWIANQSSADITFSLAYSSTLSGTAWTLRPGLAADPWQPDLSRTIEGEVTAPAGGEAHLHIFGRAPADASLGQYHFSLQAANPAADPPAWRGSTLLIATADGELPAPAAPLPAVAVGGRAAPSPATAGQALTYTLLVTNTGALPLTNLALTDTLPAHTAYLACADGDSCARNGDTVAWNLAGLGTGQTRGFTLAVQVDAGLPAGAQITNAACWVSTGQGVAAEGPAIVVRLRDEHAEPTPTPTATSTRPPTITPTATLTRTPRPTLQPVYLPLVLR